MSVVAPFLVLFPAPGRGQAIGRAFIGTLGGGEVGLGVVSRAHGNLASGAFRCV